MKCPLIKSYKITGDGAEVEECADCLNEKCAWWTPWDKSCSILTVARELALIKDELEAIKEKMPHEEQFRK